MAGGHIMSDPVVIHESKAARYVVQRRGGTEWFDDEAFHDPGKAIAYSDRQANAWPEEHYRVVDTAVTS